MTTAPDTAPVLLDVSEGVATIRLNRPEAMNSLDIATKVLLLETMRVVSADESIRAVVLTGSGRAFCTGQDLKEHVELLQHGSDQLFTTVPDHYNPLVTTIAKMPKPAIAVLNGVAAGAGTSLAMACDLRISAASAGFNFAFTNVALSCDTGASYYLQRLVGYGKAMELFYLPRTIGSDEAMELGLINQVVPDEELESTARQLATRLAAGPTVAYASVRESVAYAASHTLEDSLVYEANMMQRTGSTGDHQRAVDAFLAKQKPAFEGR